jgi:hypothetical protein
MLNPYIRPQDTITQILQQTPQREESRRNPIVIGPQYKILLNDGRNLDAAKQAFAAVGGTFSYLDENGVALSLTTYTPVEASALLYGENLQAEVASFGSGVLEEDASDATMRTIRTASGDLFAGVGSLHSVLDGRQVRVGDVLSITSTTDGNVTTVRRKVIGLVGKVTPAGAPSTFTKSNAVTNANSTTASDSGEVVTSVSTANIVLSGADSPDLTTDLIVFRQRGLVVTTVAGTNKKLGDILDISVVTPGASGVAVVRVKSRATGLTADITTAAGATNANEFLIDLADVGYPNSNVTIEDTVNDTLEAGNVVRINLFPAFTPAATATDLTIAGDYTASLNRRYVIEVLSVDTSGDPVNVKVYDTSGVEPPLTYAVALGVDTPDLGTAGMTFALAAGSKYYKGQILYVDAVADAVSTTAFDGLKLDGPAINLNDWANAASTNLDSVLVHQVYSGPLTEENLDGGGTNPLTMDASEWSYAASLGLPNTVTGRVGVDVSPFANNYGKIFLSYKALRKPTALEGPVKIGAMSELVSSLGEYHIENWLSRGAKEAFSGNQNRIVYALRTAGDTVEDFTAALNKIKSTDKYYALAPMTDDVAVMKLVRDHCEEMSNKYNKNFRRAYVGTDSPGEYVAWGAKSGGGYRQGTLVATVFTVEEDDRAISVFADADVGSSITILGLGGTYEILEVLTPYEVILDVDSGITVDPASGFTLTRPDTPANVARFVQERSTELSSRRISNVWSDNPTIVESGEVKVLPCKFLAAEIAGLRCALLPQQGLTMTEVESVTGAAGMYARFTPALLDQVASHGTWVVTQESEGGDVFIRHQLTTEVTDENALEYEDNVGVIVDDFSYAVKDRFKGYIGRRNATPDTIIEIDIALRALANSYTTVSLSNRAIGAPILTFFDENGVEGAVTVRQDGVLADTLLTYVKLRVPLPLNGINHYIDVEVSEVLASQDNLL